MSNPFHATKYLFHKQVSGLHKFLFICAVIAYFIMPFDLIPDPLIAFFGVGAIDDIGFLAMAASIFSHLSKNAIARWEAMNPLQQKIQKRADNIGFAAFWGVVVLIFLTPLPFFSGLIVATTSSAITKRLASDYFEDQWSNQHRLENRPTLTIEPRGSESSNDNASDNENRNIS